MAVRSRNHFWMVGLTASAKRSRRHSVSTSPKAMSEPMKRELNSRRDGTAASGGGVEETPKAYHAERRARSGENRRASSCTGRPTAGGSLARTRKGQSKAQSD